MYTLFAINIAVIGDNSRRTRFRVILMFDFFTLFPTQRLLPNTATDTAEELQQHRCDDVIFNLIQDQPPRHEIHVFDSSAGQQRQSAGAVTAISNAPITQPSCTTAALSLDAQSNGDGRQQTAQPLLSRLALDCQAIVTDLTAFASHPVFNSKFYIAKNKEVIGAC